MNLKKLIFVAFCCSLLVAFFWSCAGPKEAVKVEEPEKKKVVEPEKEIAKTVEPEVEYKPMVWTAALKDAEVNMGGESVIVPGEYRDYSLTIKALERNMVEVYLEEKGMGSELVMECISTLKPDMEGKIAFRVTDMNEEYLQPLFDVIGLRVLNISELRDNYYLFGSFEERGVSFLSAYDMDSSVVFEFTRK